MLRRGKPGCGVTANMPLLGRGDSGFESLHPDNNMGYEDNFLNNLDRKIEMEQKNPLEDEALIKKLGERANEKIFNSRPELDDFSGLYSQKEISEDKERVAFLQGKFNEMMTPSQERMKNIAGIFEAIVIDEAESSEWLGSRAIVYSASEYDDFMNGVDAVAEFKNNENESDFLALAMDVTFSSDIENIEKKINRVLKSVKDGVLTPLKYFADEDGNQSKMEVPRVVIGADAEMVGGLMKIWDMKSSSSEENRKKAKNNLGQHVFQTKMLLEIEMQLKGYGKFAEDHGQTEIADLYGNALKIIEEIIEEKREVMENHKIQIENDQVFQLIKKSVESLM